MTQREQIEKLKTENALLRDKVAELGVALSAAVGVVHHHHHYPPAPAPAPSFGGVFPQPSPNICGGTSDPHPGIGGAFQRVWNG